MKTYKKSFHFWKKNFIRYVRKDQLVKNSRLFIVVLEISFQRIILQKKDF